MDKETKVIGGLALIVAAMWALGGRKAKAAPVTPSVYPSVFEGTDYEGMNEAQAWAYYYQKVALSEARREEALAAMKAYIASPEKAEADYLGEIGITKGELPTYQNFALLINMELGGSYVNGVLTPPDSWAGSVTGWSRHVQEVAFFRYHQMYG